MSDDAKLVIYDVHGAKAGTATLVEGEVIFSAPEFKWIWVMDARHPPYSDLSLETILHRAHHANKRWALVGEAPDSETAE